MPTEAIHFGNQQATGDQPLAGAPEAAYNVVVDGSGAIRRRPGIVAWEDFPGTAGYSAGVNYPYTDMKIRGIASFRGKPVWIAGLTPFGGVMHYLDWWTFDVAGALLALSGVSLPVSSATARVTFAETQFRLFAAGGGSVADPSTNYWDGTVAASSTAYGPTFPGTGARASQIVALAQRILTNDDTSTTTRGRILYSGVGSTGNLTIGTLSFVNAEARPDTVVALRENSNELFVFGERTLQVFVPDGQLILAPQRTINRGCAAAHSVVQANEHYGWLDEQRQIIVSDGRDIDEVSAPIAATLDGIDTVSDCYGFRINTDQFDLMNWHFPTDGRLFSYQKGSGWSQWSTWDVDYGHVAPDITTHYYWPEENLHLVGREDGSICQLSTSAYTDMGETIKAEVTTGFINHGTDAIKFTDALHLTFKRGQTATGSTEPLILLSWRDDYGTWGTPRQIGLGTVGDYVVTKTLRSLGGYRRRQWKLEFTHDAELVLASVTEDFSVGAS